MTQSLSAEKQLESVPSAYQAELAELWQQGESLVALAELDLDAAQKFARSLLVLTNQRLLFFPAARTTPTKWTFSPLLAMRTSLHAGLGIARLLDDNQLVKTWNYTAAQAAVVERLAITFNAAIRAQASGKNENGNNSSSTCPSCGAILSPDQPVC
ncbi:MAG: hypothetical protein ACKO9H_03765, partial [Planctomycetota bacterium]